MYIYPYFNKITKIGSNKARNLNYLLYLIIILLSYTMFMLLFMTINHIIFCPRRSLKSFLRQLKKLFLLLMSYITLVQCMDK